MNKQQWNQDLASYVFSETDIQGIETRIMTQFEYASWEKMFLAVESLARLGRPIEKLLGFIDRETTRAAFDEENPPHVFCQDCDCEMHTHVTKAAYRMYWQAECHNPECDLYSVTRAVDEFPLMEDEAESYRVVVRRERIEGTL